MEVYFVYFSPPKLVSLIFPSPKLVFSIQRLSKANVIFQDFVPLFILILRMERGERERERERKGVGGGGGGGTRRRYEEEGELVFSSHLCFALAFVMVAIWYFDFD